MNLFSNILLKIFPLYFNIGLGFFAGRYLDTPRDPIARLMFFIINPLIIFNGIMHTNMQPNMLAIPFITMGISVFLCLFFYKISQNFWTDSTRNLLAFGAGSGNMGYFGLPLALLLFSDQGEGVYMMGLVGVSLYESSLGFYICAHGAHSPRECLNKLLRLPILYGFLGGLLCQFLHIKLPEIFTEFMCHIKGAYVVLGMMIIGMGLSSLHRFRIDLRFIILSSLAKFVAWPIIVITLTLMDSWWFHIYPPEVHQALILLSIVPMAVNTVIFASVLKAQPEKAASAVLISTLIALLYVPFMILYFVKPWPIFPVCPKLW